MSNRITICTNIFAIDWIKKHIENHLYMTDSIKRKKQTYIVEAHNQGFCFEKFLSKYSSS